MRLKGTKSLIAAMMGILFLAGCSRSGKQSTSALHIQELQELWMLSGV